MSKYTTEVRFICEQASGLSESKGYNDTNSIIDLAIPKVFNFDFPIFDEKYRVVLERKILKHFYTREICEETIGLWKLRLDTRLNEIMPYYNKLYNSELLEFNPLYTVELTRNRKTDLDSKRSENENINDTSSSSKSTKNNGTVDSTNTTTTTSNGNVTSNNTSEDLYSDTPQGALSGVESNTYLTNARKVTDSGITTSNTSNNSKVIGKVESGETESSTTSETYGRIRGNNDNLLSTEDYLESVSGYEGAIPSDLLQKYRETFLNIDVMIINNLEDLFFQLW